MFLYNSLTRKKEEFKPISPSNVGMYTCGPTVYDYASIGNFRTYIMADILLRTLKANNYKVKYVMNLTDVGHLTGDNLGDADLGEDRVEKAAKKEQKTAWDIAKFYINAFLKDFKSLNLMQPDVWARATDHIKEQIALVKTLEDKGFAYKTSDGIYFDVAAFEKKTGKKHAELSTLDQIKEGARVAKNPEKRGPRDFALWKLSKKIGERQMEWDSPWGIGFPGWHIECSAMSMKYLGESFDIHVGGEDLRQTHHPNEIAQSEAATGKKFVNFWMHVAFLQVDGKRMGKSLGNFFTVSDVAKKGFDPLSLRYLYLTAHYRDPLNFTWGSLEGAQRALERLRSTVYGLRQEKERSMLSEEKLQEVDEYRKKFMEAVNDDLNTPQAVAVLWEVVKSNIPSRDKYDLILGFDEILGLGLERQTTRDKRQEKLPEEVQKLLSEREKLRKGGRWNEADRVRDSVRELGYDIEDTEEGTKIRSTRKK